MACRLGPPGPPGRLGTREEGLVSQTDGARPASAPPLDNEGHESALRDAQGLRPRRNQGVDLRGEGRIHLGIPFPHAP